MSSPCCGFMDFIQNELKEVKQLCENVIPGSKLVSCVQTMVRVELRYTRFKHIIACLQFPPDYPQATLLVELKSKTLSSKLLNGITNICDQETKKIVGKPQILTVLKFVCSFITDNPLSCCYDEINAIKSHLTTMDELRLKQKSSIVCLKVTGNEYYLRTKIYVPDDYPDNCVRLENVETNFPLLFERYFVGQSKEIGRQSVEPSLNTKPQTPFQAVPSLEPVVVFLIKAVQQSPLEMCQLCKKACLPVDPKNAERDETSDSHVERVYCGHLFHLQCLVVYMKSPPFHGGKKSPACGKQIYHEKWRLSERLAEVRWAHQQARCRELQEVKEFLD